MLPEDSIPLVSAILLAGPTAWHPDYARVVEYAALCRKFATGNVASLLRPYWESESEDDFERLLGLYVATCESTWKEITTPFYQVARLRDGQVERKLTYDESISEPERARRIALVTAALDKYYNNKPLQDYLAEHTMQTVAMTDPNAWLLTEFGTFDFRTQKARPYPVLLPSSAVIDFTRHAGTVTSMTARYEINVTVDNTQGLSALPNAVLAAITQQQTLYRYTTYLPDHAVDFWPVDSKGNPTIPGGTFDDVVQEEGGKILYHYKVYAHNAGQVPACPIGYVPDPGATSLVFLSPLHAAISWLKLELKTGHELQIVMRNMAMPRQLQYVQPCPGIDADGGCNNGYCTSPRDGNYHDLRCRICKGTRNPGISKSASDVIEIPLSPLPEENKFKLTDYLAFIGPDPAIPDFQLKFQDWIADKLKQKLFGTTILSKATITQTATERMSQLDQLAIALSPFADQFSYCYTYHGTISAVYVDAGGGLNIVYDFPEDLQLKSADDLYDQLSRAVLAGVRSDEIARIQNAIMRKTHASDPEGLRRYAVKSRFIPTLGLPDQLVIQVYALGKIPESDFLVRFNHDRIFTDAEQANPKFYDLPYKDQAALVKEQVELIRAELPANTANAFPRVNMNPTPQPAPAVPAVV
jgi:hypothetical protein